MATTTSWSSTPADGLAIPTLCVPSWSACFVARSGGDHISWRTVEFDAICTESAGVFSSIGRSNDGGAAMAEQRPEPVAREAYEKLADSYSARAPTKPHNAYYERPATMGLLGDVAGRRVLDAGCGPGVYAEELLARGAEVTGLDASERMIELARERLRGRAEVRRANLEEPLPWLANDSFDLVVSTLVMDCVEDWGVPLSPTPRPSTGSPRTSRSSWTRKSQ